MKPDKLTLSKPNPKDGSQMNRAEFLRIGSGWVAGAILGGSLGPNCAQCEQQKCLQAIGRPVQGTTTPGPNHNALENGSASQEATATPAPSQEGSAQGPGSWPRMTLRPYQLLCAICTLGEDPTGAKAGKLKPILEQISRNPNTAITLRCNVREVFGFQTSGADEDTPEGADFNNKRDLDILYRLQFPPGITLPARILVNHLLERITTSRGICDPPGGTAEVWKVCPKADQDYYEKGRQLQRTLCLGSCGDRAKGITYEQARAKGIVVLVPPRTLEDLAHEKKASLAAMYRAKHTGIPVKPHILLCAVCQYGGGVRPPCPENQYGPAQPLPTGYPDDNLPELVDLILKDPEARITLTEGVPWTVCGPCPGWDRQAEACVHVLGHGGLTNQLRDLRMLQILGLHFGDTMNGQELFRRIFERIPNTVAVCRFESPATSLWHDGCGDNTENNPSYEKGRKELMQKLNRR